MGKDHAAQTPPTMADKALSVCMMKNKLDRIKTKADYNQLMHEIEIRIPYFKYSLDFPKKYQNWEFLFFPEGNLKKIILIVEMF